MNESRRVLFVDDEPHVLDSIRLLLRTEDFDSVFAGSASRALQVIEQAPVSVVVADEDMPGRKGADLLVELADRFPQTVLLMLTGRPTLNAAVKVINSARIFRFLNKPCAPEKLRTSLNDAFAEHDRRSTAAPIPAYPERLRRRIPSQQVDELSARELEVLEHLVDGKRVPQLASHLFISPHTVRNHLKHIFQKLDVRSQGELIEKCKT